MTVVDDRTGMPDEGSLFVGTDPGDGETWDIQRLRCPECERPIAMGRSHSGQRSRWMSHVSPSPGSVPTNRLPSSGMPVRSSTTVMCSSPYDPLEGPYGWVAGPMASTVARGSLRGLRIIHSSGACGRISCGLGHTRVRG